MSSRCELASTNFLAVYRLGNRYVIVARGMRTSANLSPQIRQLPMEIYPPQFAVELCGEPGGLRLVPYSVTKTVSLGPNIRQLTIVTAEGRQNIKVKPLPTASPKPKGKVKVTNLKDVVKGKGTKVTKPAGTIIVEGISTNLSFDEAYADAIEQLMRQQPGGADRMLTAKVVETGSVHGGIAV